MDFALLVTRENVDTQKLRYSFRLFYATHYFVKNSFYNYGMNIDFLSNQRQDLKIYAHIIFKNSSLNLKTIRVFSMWYIHLKINFRSFKTLLKFKAKQRDRDGLQCARFSSKIKQII